MSKNKIKSNGITALMVLFLGVFVSTVALAHGPHPGISKNKSAIKKLDKKTDHRFAETSDAVIHSENSIVGAIGKSAISRDLGVKKTTDVMVKTLDAHLKGVQAISTTSFDARAVQEANFEFLADTAKPSRGVKNQDEAKSLRNGLVDKQKFLDNMQGYLLDVDNLSPKEYKKTVSSQTARYNKDPKKYARVLAKMFNETLPMNRFKSISGAVHHIVRGDKPSLVPKSALRTAKGRRQQGEIRKIVAVQNLIETLLVEQVANNASNPSRKQGGLSTSKMIMESVEDRFLNASTDIATSNRAGTARAIYEALTLQNYLLAKQLRHDEIQTLLSILAVSDTLNNRLKVIKNQISGN